MKQVYVIDFGDKVKVGITDDVKRRIYQIQCSTGAKAIRFAAISGDYSLERKVQRGISEYHIVGEFFSCSFDFACSMLGVCCGETISSEHIFFPDIKLRLSLRHSPSRSALVPGSN